MTSPLRPAVVRKGQPYVDEAVMQTVSLPDTLASNIARAFKSPVPDPIEELSHYERVRLRWMKPDGRGGFVPK